MIDIDHFKSVNDRFGHSTGDQVIMLVASALMSQLRPDDLLCRYGGEEFCVLLPDADAGQARAVAERLRDAVEANVCPGLRLPAAPVITASFGVAGGAERRPSLDALINAADGALYESKRAGRNRVTMAA
jgi:diguanylate cyclase (GGDEF)-like protein